MQNSINISVLLAVHNPNEYLLKTIDSILKQNYSDFEFIIVVNCSDEKVLSLISTFEDERIKVFQTPICQLAYNLNFGLQQAQGEYIARIDADDIANENRLLKQLEVIEEYGYDIVGSNLTYIDENDNPIGEKTYPETNAHIRRKIYFSNPLAHPSVLYRKKTVLQNGGYLNGRNSEDYDLWLRLMRQKDVSFYNIQEPLTKYRIHSDQSKGNRLAYCEVAGFMLREALYLRSFKFFVATIVGIFKALLK